MKRYLLLLLVTGLTLLAQTEASPAVVLFTGASADPNGTTTDASIDLGGAKLVGSSVYLGGVIHVSKATAPGVRISTKLQLHVARLLTPFRSAKIYWTAELGPDFVAQQSEPIPPGTGVTNVGYAIGSGPLASIPIGRGAYLMPHAEVTKGSMQDLGWRGGILIGFGSN